MNKLLAHWKTSAIGILICMLALDRTIHFDTAGHLAMTARDWFGSAAGLMTAAVGMLQKDAGTQLAQVPGQSEPTVVDSHETPDNPKAVPVKENS